MVHYFSYYIIDNKIIIFFFIENLFKGMKLNLL